jgi:hypothetical protein
VHSALLLDTTMAKLNRTTYSRQMMESHRGKTGLGKNIFCHNLTKLWFVYQISLGRTGAGTLKLFCSGNFYCEELSLSATSTLAQCSGPRYRARIGYLKGLKSLIVTKSSFFNVLEFMLEKSLIARAHE